MPRRTNFEWNAGSVESRLRELDDRTHASITAAFEFTAATAEGMMKANAPWTDRTGAARSGLHTNVDVAQRAWTLVLSHSVNYGIWLETREDFHGRYAIILPTLIQAGEQLMNTLELMFRRQ